MEAEHLEAAIAAQEALRGVVPDEVVDAAIAGLRVQLATAAHDLRRRLVTALFADVSGFTAMSEVMDAEEVSALMNELWSRLDAIVVARGARIDKHMGDALMALWGADSTREDDPEQAIRAALELQEAVQQLRSETGSSLSLRIGISTGPVVIGAVGTTGESSAIGDAVNVASRLEGAAPVDGVLLSHDTYRHVRGVFDVTPQAPLTVKGKARPLRTYSVQAAKPRAFRLPTRGVEGVETSLVGRDRELAALREALVGVETSRRSAAVAVIGEAGVGKSRLLWEFEDWLELREERVYFLSGRAVRGRGSAPLALLRDIVATRLQIADGDAPEVVVAKVRDGTADVLDPRDALVLARWLGFDLQGADRTGLDGVALARAGRLHLERLLRGLAAAFPLVVVVEDLHWADDASVVALGELLGALADAPWFMVIASRPDAGNGPLSVLSDQLDAELVLDALSASDATALVREILDRVDDLPARFVDAIVQRGEGNAFYLEELVKMLIDDGAIVTGPERWTLRDESRALDTVPATLTGVLQARLDSLDTASLRLLQLASIIGRTFWDDAVSGITEDEVGKVDFGPLLVRELIFRHDPSTFADCAEFTFKHALLHDVAYETVLLAERRGLHAGAATWLEERAGARRDEFLVEIAEHRRLAGQDLEAARLLDRACDLAQRAGDLATSRTLGETAIARYEAAGVEAPPTLHTALCLACRQLGELVAADEFGGQAVELARRSGDDRALAGALVAAAQAATRLGHIERADALLREARGPADRVGGTVLGDVLVALGWAELEAGRTDGVGEMVQRVLDIAERCDQSTFIVRAHLFASAYNDLVFDHDASRRHLETSREVSRRTGDRWGEFLSLNNLGVSLHLRGDRELRSEYHRAAERSFRDAMDLAEQLHLREQLALTKLNLAQLSLRLHDPLGAATLLAAGLREAIEIQAMTLQLYAVVVRADLLLEAGERHAAATLLATVRACTGAESIGDEFDRLAQRVGPVAIDAAAARLPTGDPDDRLDGVLQEMLRDDGS